MEYRPFGRTGVMVSPLCLGTLNFGGPTDERESLAIIEKAVAGGINCIDTANTYNKGETERIVGRALKRMGNRDRVFLATKVFNTTGDGPNDRGVSRLHILRECENSLRRLQVECIDLYQLHRPSFEVPPDETLRALDDLVRAGKVRYIGTSTFPAWKIMEAIAISERLGLNRYVSEQPPWPRVSWRGATPSTARCPREAGAPAGIRSIPTASPARARWSGSNSRPTPGAAA